MRTKRRRVLGPAFDNLPVSQLSQLLAHTIFLLIASARISLAVALAMLICVSDQLSSSSTISCTNLFLFILFSEFLLFRFCIFNGILQTCD